MWYNLQLQTLSKTSVLQFLSDACIRICDTEAHCPIPCYPMEVLKCLKFLPLDLELLVCVDEFFIW